MVTIGRHFDHFLHHFWPVVEIIVLSKIKIWNFEMTAVANIVDRFIFAFGYKVLTIYPIHVRR